jgi:hypothetical protein
MMRKVKSHWPAGDVYLSSSALASVDRAYHKILGCVKGMPDRNTLGQGRRLRNRQKDHM